MANAYPLEWPKGWKRTEPSERRNAQFNKKTTTYSGTSSYQSKKWLTVADGTARIIESLERMGIQNLVISTNVALKLNGQPRSGEPEPQDPGAAIYWSKDANSPQRCMAIDRYTTVADNLAAIAATLEAMRAIERHGGAEILDRSFAGFKALAATSEEWWDVLECHRDATPELIQTQYKARVRAAHPDSGGSVEAMQRLNIARDRALAPK